MIVRKIMNKKVRTIHQEKTLSQASRIMRRSGYGTLVVEGGDKLTGIITDRDIAIGAVAEGRNVNSEKVKHHMSKELKYCFADDSVEEASRLMMQNKKRRLPVLNKNKKLVGILSLTDFVKKRDSGKLIYKTLNKIAS